MGPSNRLQVVSMRVVYYHFGLIARYVCVSWVYNIKCIFNCDQIFKKNDLINPALEKFSYVYKVTYTRLFIEAMFAIG